MKILWHSNSPWSNTGYGVQTALFTPRLKALGHEVALSANYGLAGSVQSWNGMRVYPSDGNFGNRTLGVWAAHFATDGNHGAGHVRDALVITLADTWPLKAAEIFSQLNIAAWCPIDHEPVPAGVADFFRRTSAKPIAMSRFGERELRAAGFDPLYVPHGVETSVYRPLPESECREFRELIGVPDNAFIVGMVANNAGRNPSRKAFPQAIDAFARFRETHPDAFLYLHAEPLGVQDGINLDKVLNLCGVPEHAVRWISPFLLEYGLPAPAMAQVYSAMDVLLSPSMGEGFGVPIIEAQACGTPVIVGGWTAMDELVGAGWKVDGDRWYDQGGMFGVTQEAFFHNPHIGSIVEALDAAYSERGNTAIAETAREFAMEYDADAVTEHYWRPTLAALTGDETLPTVKLNRSQRRKLARAK